jgi:hypothetical protein
MEAPSPGYGCGTRKRRLTGAARDREDALTGFQQLALQIPRSFGIMTLAES